MNENNPNTDKDQNQNEQQPFDYQAHYRQQNQQYQNPQQPYNGQYYQPPQPPIPPVPPQPPVYPQYTMPVDNTKAFSILSYIGILWLVGLLADGNNPRVRFHVNQGIILTIFEIAVNVAISIVKSIISVIFIQSFSGFMMLSQLGMVVNGILSLAGTCLCVAYIIIGVLHAAQGREEPLPIIGTLFQVLK
ncbi:MAG: hypothetical protein K0Q85_562 [Caproiciproducens sp.]|jgi:hypothetical protein|nr:hypothetical protein [Caproiciproducens sp.]